jgi:hypothetical protein
VTFELRERIFERSIMAQQLEASLTEHKRLHLAELLEAAKICKRGPLKRYLEAGGTPDAVVRLEQSENKIFKVPLLHSAVLNHHRGAEHAEGVEILLSAGARVDSVGYAPDGCDPQLSHVGNCHWVGLLR